MKRCHINWKEIQAAHDDGLTWRQIRDKFHLCYATIVWAKKRGFLVLREMSSAAKLAWKSGSQNAEKYKTPEFRKKQSRFGGFKPRAGHCKHIKYTMRDGTVVDLQGTWELKFAMFLDDHKIEWERNRVGYKYNFGGKERDYFPDFFLPSHATYVEVKGYETERDREKWKQFPFKLLVVKKQEIQDLTSWRKHNLI